MSKKKKLKLKTLNDEEYNQYIMALKDEEPTKVIGSDGKLHVSK